MSLALLKKSLEIFEEHLTPKETDKQKDAREPAKTKQKRNRNSETYATKNRITKIKDIKQELNQGEKKANENLKRLLALSRNTLKETDAEKFVKRAHKGRYEDIELPKREIESIFTEEDFRAFEEEYFKS